MWRAGPRSLRIARSPRFLLGGAGSYENIFVGVDRDSASLGQRVQTCLQPNLRLLGARFHTTRGRMGFLGYVM